MGTGCRVWGRAESWGWLCGYPSLPLILGESSLAEVSKWGPWGGGQELHQGDTVVHLCFDVKSPTSQEGSSVTSGIAEAPPSAHSPEGYFWPICHRPSASCPSQLAIVQFLLLPRGRIFLLRQELMVLCLISRVGDCAARPCVRLALQPTRICFIYVGDGQRGHAGSVPLVEITGRW